MGVIQELNRLIFKFLWKGVDKVTRLSTINDYEKSGLKMIDLETMVKSLRLAWLKRIFSENDGTWKNYLHHVLDFFMTFFESGITYITDLRFDLDITESYNIITKKMKKANILVWAGLRHAVPSHLISKSKTNNRTFLTMPPSLNIENNVFDILMKKSKDYYTKLISKKAKFSNNSLILKRDFSLNEDQLRKVFLLPHMVCSEAYVKAFQYKVLNSILYTNTKLHKIGYITDDKCTSCKSEPETLLHLLFNCVYSKLFWKDFEFYFYSLSKEFVHLSLQDVVIGITTSECPLLNYFLLIAKLYIWDCRRSQILPSLAGFKIKIKIKFEMEKYICTKNKTLDQFRKKWGTIFSCGTSNYSF